MKWPPLGCFPLQTFFKRQKVLALLATFPNLQLPDWLAKVTKRWLLYICSAFSPSHREYLAGGGKKLVRRIPMSENADLGKQRVQAIVCFWVAHFFPQTCHVGIVLLYRKLDWAFRELNTKINRHKYFLFSPLTQLAGGKSRKEKRKEKFFARFFCNCAAVPSWTRENVDWLSSGPVHDTKKNFKRRQVLRERFGLGWVFY